MFLFLNLEIKLNTKRYVKQLNAARNEGYLNDNNLDLSSLSFSRQARSSVISCSNPATWFNWSVSNASLQIKSSISSLAGFPYDAAASAKCSLYGESDLAGWEWNTSWWVNQEQVGEEFNLRGNKVPNMNQPNSLLQPLLLYNVYYTHVSISYLFKLDRKWKTLHFQTVLQIVQIMFIGI